jgi:hypothetical protein
MRVFENMTRMAERDQRNLALGWEDVLDCLSRSPQRKLDPHQTFELACGVIAVLNFFFFF